MRTHEQLRIEKEKKYFSWSISVHDVVSAGKNTYLHKLHPTPLGATPTTYLI